MANWVKFRKPISDYPMTQQQKKVKIGGKLIKEKCAGKKGSDFRRCRTEILACAFDDDKCDEGLKALKQKLLEET